MVLKQQVGVNQQVIEVKGIGLLQTLLQLNVHLGRILGQRVCSLLLIIQRTNKFVFGCRDLIANGIHRIAFRVDIQVIHNIFDQGF